MNKTQRGIGLTAMILLLVIGIVWAVTGFHILTKTEIPVEQVDDLFGTKTIIWQKTCIVGLDILGPAMISIILVTVLLLFIKRSRDI